MINGTSKQTGSIHVAIVGVIILAIVSGLGFVLWNNTINKKTESQGDTSSQVSSHSTDGTSKASSQTPVNKIEQDPYAGWQSYSLKREGLSFKYPSSWKLIDNSETANVCAANAQNCPAQSDDSVQLNSPSGLEMGITTGSDLTPRMKGQGCPASRDSCIQYESMPVVINGKNLYMVVTGYKEYNVAENFELGITQSADCILYCREGLGAAHNLPGNIQVYATYPDRDKATYEEFKNDDSVKDAELIMKSLHY